MSDKLFTVEMDTCLFLYSEQDGHLGETTLAQFLWNNRDGFLDHTVGEMVESLETTGRYVGGGGASPMYALTTENLYTFPWPKRNDGPAARIFVDYAGVTYDVDLYEDRPSALKHSAHYAREVTWSRSTHGWSDTVAAMDDLLDQGDYQAVLDLFNEENAAEQKIIIADSVTDLR